MFNFTKSVLLFSIMLQAGSLLAQPGISSVNPKSGPAGTLVTISGSNFGTSPDKNSVYFGAAKATVVSATSSALVVKAPAGSTYEPIKITSDTSTIYGDPFSLTFPGGVNIDSASFQPKLIFSVLQGAYSVAVADLDGDGKSDIAYGNAGTGPFPSPGVSVMPNTSTINKISFGQRLDYSIGGTNYDIAVGDLNGDGKPEIAVPDYVFGNFRILQNTSTPGAISFKSLGSFSGSPYATGINIADFDGDGKPDIVTVSATGFDVNSISFSIYRNTGINGTITFAPKINFSTSGAARVSTVDVDGDGKIDLVYSTNKDTALSFFKNISTPGNISFASAIAMGVPSRITTVGDADGDGKADIVEATATGVSFFRNTGTKGAASFASAVNYNTGVSFNQMFFLDIDGDSKPDLIGFNSTINVVYVLKNKSTPGNISFADKVGYGTGGRLYFITGGDLDGDSKPEIVTYNMTDSISILRNKIAEPTTVASGPNPVTGNVANTVMVDQTVQTYNGNPYVQRHYDIEPDNNPATSTATITIYFTQEDFNGFNSYPSHGLSLPSSPGDNVGIANLRINQYHGTSSSGVPGTYSGTNVEINPDDSKIVWNDLLKRWEITFDVNGFSGFFIGSPANVALPVSLTSFNGIVKQNNVLLQWTTTGEIAVDSFELQKSINGGNYMPISKVMSKGAYVINNQYSYTDKLDAANTYFYRLKMIDKDGSYKFSNIIKIDYSGQQSALSLYPNPAHGYLTIEVPVLNIQSELKLVDMTGKTVKIYPIGKNSTSLKINLGNIKPGSYKALWSDGTSLKVQTLVVE